MSTAIKLKKSSVIGRAPGVNDIAYGELAINYADGKLYYKTSGNAINSFIDSDNVVSSFNTQFSKKTTTNLSEGSNLYYTTARADSDAKAAISVTDAGGDGSLTYNSGSITYTGPSATEVRAHFTAGTGVTISSGEVSIGQAVSTTSDVTFAKITSDSAVLDGISFVANPGTYAGGNTVGTLFWDSDEQKGLSFVTRTREGFPGATINVGQESVIYVHNQTGATISNGDAVYISGTAHGLHPSVTKARANAAVTGTLAIATQDIVDNAHGYVTRFGLVRDVNTDGLTAGDEIYLSADSAGKWTTTPVTVDNGYPLHIGKVVRVDATTGTILVDPFTEHFDNLRIQTALKVTGDITGSTLTVDSSMTFTAIDDLKRPAYSEGTVWYDADAKTLGWHTENSDYIHFAGEREWVRGRNSSGVTITKGTPVYTDGVHISGHPIHGHHPLIYAADASDASKYEVIGLAAHDITNGAHGYVITRGWIDGINTANLTSGNRFHLAAGGGYQSDAPGYPNYPVDLGIALTVDSAGGGGSIYVDINSHTQERIRITGDGRVDGNWTVGGNLNVVGVTTQAITQSLTVSSNFLKLLDGDTLGTAYQNYNATGLNDATFKGKYTGDSDLFFFIDISATDSAGGGGDTIRFGISDSDTIGEGQYGVPFDSAGGPITWKLGTDGKTAPLRNGITIQFVSATGHIDSDMWCAHPTELNTDLGFIGNYNPAGPGGLRYTGLFRDTSDSRWKFFEGSTQSFDSTGTIEVDTGNAGYSLANVQANTFYGALSGNASTATSATQLTTGRNFSLTGDITANAVSFDGTGNVQLTTAYNPGSIVNADINASAAIADTKLATISTAGKVQNGATTATSANTASAIVARDASGDFSAAAVSLANLYTTGNVGIGTSSPSLTGLAILTGGQGKGVLVARNASGNNPTSGQSLGSYAFKGIMDGVNSNSAAEAMIEAVAAENHSGSTAATNLLFYTKPSSTGPGSGPTEGMRLDNSGNLLVGKTTTSGSVTGLGLYNFGLLEAVVDGDIAATLKRLNSDGEILRFRKDSTTVGSIGTANGGDLYIGNDDTGILFAGGSDAVIPYNPAGPTNRDAAVDLGLSANRFKDLYLSGGVVLDEAYNTSTTATTTTISQTAVASFSATTYGSAEIVVTAKDGSNRHITKLLIVHNGTTASATQYGTVVTNSTLATYEVDISGGNVRLLATPISTNSTVFNIAMTLIDA